MNKRLPFGLAMVAVVTLVPFATLAHISVKPAEVGLAQFQTFSMGVPVEKDIATTSLRLVIPEGLEHVTPTVKPGWDIDIKKDGEGEEATVKEIVWSGGQIPVGQRDDFSFSAKSPAEKGELAWKAYQTYTDDSVVAWDQKLEENGHTEKPKEAGAAKATPYSVTKVVDDLAKDGEHGSTDGKDGGSSKENAALALSVGAIVLAGAAWARRRR